MKFVALARHETSAFADLLVIVVRCAHLCSCPGSLQRARESGRRPWTWPWSGRSDHARGSLRAGAVVFDSSRFRRCRCWLVGSAEPAGTTQARFVADYLRRLDAPIEGIAAPGSACGHADIFVCLRGGASPTVPHDAWRASRHLRLSTFSRRFRGSPQRYPGLSGSKARLCPVCDLPGRLLRPSATVVVNALYRCTSCGAVWVRDMRDPTAPPRILVRPSD
jgi:hypothetical protein